MKRSPEKQDFMSPLVTEDEHLAQENRWLRGLSAWSQPCFVTLRLE